MEPMSVTRRREGTDAYVRGTVDPRVPFNRRVDRSESLIKGFPRMNCFRGEGGGVVVARARRKKALRPARSLTVVLGEPHHQSKGVFVSGGAGTIPNGRTVSRTYLFLERDYLLHFLLPLPLLLSQPSRCRFGAADLLLFERVVVISRIL